MGFRATCGLSYLRNFEFPFSSFFFVKSYNTILCWWIDKCRDCLISFVIHDELVNAFETNLFFNLYLRVLDSLCDEFRYKTMTVLFGWWKYHYQVCTGSEHALLDVELIPREDPQLVILNSSRFRDNSPRKYPVGHIYVVGWRIRKETRIYNQHTHPLFNQHVQPRNVHEGDMAYLADYKSPHKIQNKVSILEYTGILKGNSVYLNPKSFPFNLFFFRLSKKNSAKSIKAQ